MIQLLFTFIFGLTVTAENPSEKPTAITLSPHLTELVFSAGGGAQLVGVSAYSDHPKTALDKTVIGDAFRLDLEAIHHLQPQLIFYWVNGTAQQTLQQLKQLDAKLIPIEINTLADIPTAVNQISDLLNTESVPESQTFMSSVTAHKQPKKFSALIQIGDQPIYTVDASHWMSEVLSVCGLQNVFESLPSQSAAVTMESVVALNPQAIVRLSPDSENNPLRKWPKLAALQHNRIAVLNPNHFSRPTLRTLKAVEALCDQVSTWQENTN